MTTLNLAVGASADDGHEIPATSPNLTATAIEVGDHGGSTVSIFRFIDVTIDQGATIDSATLTLTGADSYTIGSPSAVTVGCEDVDNSAQPTTVDGNVANRTMTTATTGWTVTTITLDQEYQIDVASAVQEVIDRASWSNGNALSVLIIDNTCPNQEWQLVYSYDGSTTKCAQLDIVYSTGGTAYNQSVSGGITPAGALIKQDQKVLAGSITPSASLIKEAQKILTGAITPAGALIKQIQKILDSSITPSGALATVKTFLISLVGSITPSGSLFKETQKILSGSITPVGDFVKQVQKVLDGGITPSGVLAGIKTVLIDLVGSIAPSGSLVIQTQKTLTGAITPVGNLLKETQRILTGVITPAGTLLKEAQKVLSGSIVPAGTLLREIQKVLTGSVAPSSTITKLTGKLLDGVITPTSTLVGVITGAGITIQTSFKGMFRGMFRRM